MIYTEAQEDVLDCDQASFRIRAEDEMFRLGLVPDQHFDRNRFERDIAFYENDAPEFVASELKRLYSNPYSTLPALTLKGALSFTTYVARHGFGKSAIILFQQHRKTIRVLNEGMRISEYKLMCFAQAAFARYPSAEVIHFHAIDSKIKGHQLPCQQYAVLEDIVVNLPQSPEAYRKSLGKSTRAELNRSLNKLKRECPSFRHEVFVGEEIGEDLVRELVDMHKSRMASKGTVSNLDEGKMQELLHLTRKFGFAVVVYIEGRVCAGTINYQVGDHYFGELLAHDPGYNHYRLGILCTYLTICECIARSGEECHFLWGDYDYKFRLRGAGRQLNDIYLYRSRRHMLMQCGLVLKVAARAILLNARKWIKKRFLHKAKLMKILGSLGVLPRSRKNGGVAS